MTPISSQIFTGCYKFLQSLNLNFIFGRYEVRNSEIMLNEYKIKIPISIWKCQATILTWQHLEQYFSSPSTFEFLDFAGAGWVQNSGVQNDTNFEAKFVLVCTIAPALSLKLADICGRRYCSSLVRLKLVDTFGRRLSTKSGNSGTKSVQDYDVELNPKFQLVGQPLVEFFNIAGEGWTQNSWTIVRNSIKWHQYRAKLDI